MELSFGEPKRKMQNVKFKTINDCFDFLPENELEIALALRNILLETIPNCTEYLSFNVPFYKRHYSIAFIWPSSVLWGSKKTNKGVRLGFAKGYLLNDEIGFLVKENRKQVYWKDYTDLSQINENIIRSYLINAVEIDEMLALNRKK
jgi:hypothetical protein